MIRETRVAPSHSLILVMDRTVGEIPETLNQSLVAASQSCIAVGTRCADDGSTFIALSDETPPDLPQQPPVVDRVIPTPSKKLSVCSVVGEVFVFLDVPKARTRVQVWTNDDMEPDKIWIRVGDLA